jgi:hypothetical protein
MNGTYPELIPIEYPKKPNSEVRILGYNEPVKYEWKNGMNWKINLANSTLASQEAIVFYFKKSI